MGEYETVVFRGNGISDIIDLNKKIKESEELKKIHHKLEKVKLIYYNMNICKLFGKKHFNKCWCILDYIYSRNINVSH